MSPSRPDIVALEWDDENEAHVEQRIDAWLIDEMIEAGTYFAFPNTAGHPPGRMLFLGHAPSGMYLAAVLQEPREDKPGVWRPITAWPASSTQKRRYLAEKKRRGR